MAGQPAWYLIHTKPRQERIAAEHLMRQDYCVYMPMLGKRRNRDGKQTDTPTPLFPRYLFVRLSEGVDDWGPIRSTKGVHDFVRFGAKPAQVPSELIDEIKKREGDNGLHYEMDPEFNNGDKIHITDGPFCGCDAVFKTHRSKDRVLILLDIVGKSSHVEIAAGSVSKYSQ